ncbi:MAG: 50S ribosomal protein L32e [Thermofilum sp.]|jgi:large subunit ribosomal protein L32e|nr:50S ribosomal protein L32e [Thermofilum sp.]
MLSREGEIEKAPQVKAEAAAGTREESIQEEKKVIKPSLATEEQRMLRLRQRISKYRPRFMRMNSWRMKRLEDTWRSPRTSIDNQVRKQIKGFPPLVKVGYRGPRLVRGLHPSGFEEVIVHNVEELKKIDPKRQAVRIARTVGRRRRIEIIKKAEEIGVKLLNG